MEKLIELLNEFEGDGFVSIHWDENIFKDDLHYHYRLQVISKSYGFIKWLVDNDKINHEKIKSGELNGSKWYFETVQPEYFVLMLLAISDNPIEFLISYLK